MLTGLDVSNNENLIDLKVDRNPSLSCIKTINGQDIPSVTLSNHQVLNDLCNKKIIERGSVLALVVHLPS